MKEKLVLLLNILINFLPLIPKVPCTTSITSYSDEFINILKKIFKDIDEIKKSIDETFKENEDGRENCVEQTTQANVNNEDTIEYYVISDESNGINQDIVQDKYITYPSNEKNDNEIIDKEK